MVREAGDLTEDEAWKRSAELSREVFASPDSVEGARAFAEKRATGLADHLTRDHGVERAQAEAVRN